MTSLIMRGLARYLNLAYGVASVAQAGKLKALREIHPRAYVRSSVEIKTIAKEQTVKILGELIRELTGQSVQPAKLEPLIQEGLAINQFELYGNNIVINPFSVTELITRLNQLPEINTGPKLLRAASFKRQAIAAGLLLSFAYTEAGKIHGQTITLARALARGLYVEEPSVFPTRDKKWLKMSKTINPDALSPTAADIMLLPGIACPRESFDLAEDASFLLDLADRGHAVISFEPRGIGQNSNQVDYKEECFLDTHVSDDLPAALKFAYDHNGHRQIYLIGHSKGGITAECTVIRQSYKLNIQLQKICERLNRPVFSTVGHTRKEISSFLRETERSAQAESVRGLIAKARVHLGILKAVKAIITLGSPKIFDKNAHPIFPFLLSLNHILPRLWRWLKNKITQNRVPVDFAKNLPGAARFLLLNDFIDRADFASPKKFIKQFLDTVHDFPRGVGFQLLKAIFNGKGIKRADPDDPFNYSANLHLIPVDLPVFMIVGQKEPLCQPYNLAFIDHSYYRGGPLDFSQFPLYSHAKRNIHELHSPADVRRLRLRPTKNQVLGFVVPHTGHYGYFYGNTANAITLPLIYKIISAIERA